MHRVGLTLWVSPEEIVLEGGDAQRDIDVLASGESSLLRVQAKVGWDSSRDGAAEHRVLAAVQFTDMADQRWIRNHQHRLQLWSEYFSPRGQETRRGLSRRLPFIKR